ncbi:MAG: FADH(2)-oxidizing methylenetetrahydrofolate--tRNA-(uracil(54)-C(5))-methyltransferase TrmFO [Bacillota bacterium]
MGEEVTVIGAGLAGAEAAWQVARRGVRVKLYEMRPIRMTPAHHSGFFAELVCSNSLRAISLQNAVGLLKEEMRLLSSLVMECAGKAQLPAGGALAVDRQEFAALITERLESHPLVEVVRSEVTEIPSQRPLVIATGPLTSPAFSSALEEITGPDSLYFYDAASPIVAFDSINLGKAFFASRYEKGGRDYLNCPLDAVEYDHFYDQLCRGAVYAGKEFEKEIFFEGCMPVEVLAARGKDTLRFGPLKPVGLAIPATGEQPYAVVQLRRDNREGTLYNMVGFQTRLLRGEQQRIFRLIPGLEKARFVRYGAVHRNTFINSPLLLEANLEVKKYPGVFFAGQITGVEGYVESAVAGLVAGINAYCRAIGEEPLIFPPETTTGALLRYITTADPQHFQPMNVNYGLMPPLPAGGRKRDRKERMAKRSLETLSIFRNNFQHLLA